MACSFFPDKSCCPRTPPMELSNTVKYKINDRLGAEVSVLVGSANTA